MANHPSVTLTRACQGSPPPEHRHRGVVPADAAYPSAAPRARAAHEDPLMRGGHAPRPDRGVVVLEPRPGERAVEDVAAGQAELALEVLRRVRLQAGQTGRVAG